MKRRVVVGFSGGVTSAWCAGWALENYPREEVVLLNYDTKEEDPDTYRFLHEMAAALRVPITDYSDGRSVTELFYEEGFLGNNQNAMCSRILKRERGEEFTRQLRSEGFHVVRVYGFSEKESDRVQRAWAAGEAGGYEVRFPMIETKTTKQIAADWCSCTIGVKPPAMYEWADHANCVGCVKGGREYWLAVHKHRPDVFWQRARMEREFGHPIIRGGGRPSIFLDELIQIGLKRKVNRREAITIGPCECGD